LNKISGDDTLNPVLSAPPSVELLGLTTPRFQTRTHDTRFQTILTPLHL